MQRVAIARALTNRPRILLADEPTGNLDKENSEKVISIFKDIAKSGVSVIVITHDESLASVFDYTLRLNRGKLESFLENK